MDPSAEQLPKDQETRQNSHPRPQGNNATGRPWRGRGGFRNSQNASTSDRRDFNNLRRGRGRGNRDHMSNGRKRDQVSSNLEPPTPELQPPPGVAGGDTFGVHPTKAAESGEDEFASTQDGEVDSDADVCFICASPVVHNAIAPCNHRTCHICALRLRALYKTRACAHCRVSTAPAISTRLKKLIRAVGGGSPCNLH